MASARRVTPKCFFVAWIFGWVVAIYAPSGLLAAAGLSPLASGRGWASATFAVADEVSPAAKIGFALIFGLLLFASRKRLRIGRRPAVAADMLAGTAAMIFILAVLPADWSRGFGIGLAGTRFAPEPTLIYIAGALLAGLVFCLSEARCLALGADGDRAGA